ncbi:hypothetical protein BFJ71_g15819 [Fusarium oxysporum]|nr:hypothetical protein BFJ71_g15819 [Fusarium oxysporum]
MANHNSTSSADSDFVGRAAVLKGKYGEPYVIEFKPNRQGLGPLEVLVHILYSGVCYGDLHSREGGPPAPSQPLRPLVGGHEGVGKVVKLGAAVGEVSNVKAGDVVGMGWRHSACGRCKLCLDGLENSCPDQVVNGLQIDGTFRVSVGKWVAISGAAGGLGHLAIQYAKAMGAHVVAIDGPESDRADRYIDCTDKDVPAAVLKASGGGFHSTMIVNSHPSSYL